MADQKISELTDDPTPTNDDLLVTVNDPAGTPATKKVTWTNVKAFLKTYFDTLYQAVGGGGFDLFSTTTKGANCRLIKAMGQNDNIAGTGSTADSSTGLTLLTGATNDSTVGWRMGLFGDVDFSKSYKWRALGRDLTTGANRYWKWFLGNVDDATTHTGKHAGFRGDGTTKYASNANGTTETATAITLNLSVVDFKVIYTAATSYLFYDGATLRATHTTNLATGTVGNAGMTLNFYAKVVSGGSGVEMYAIVFNFETDI